MGTKQILAHNGCINDFGFEIFEKNREFRQKFLIGEILLSLHKKQGTQACLVEAIEPYLEKEDRLLFGLV